MLAGKIYKIISPSTDEVYIGSIIRPLQQRLYAHIHALKGWRQGLSGHVGSFDIICTGDAEIILLEEYPCENREQLAKKEQEWIDNTPNCCNNYKAYTGIPYGIDKTNYNRLWSQTDKCKETQKKYHQTENFKTYVKQYREANLENIKDNKKHYREVHSEEIKEYNKQYREANQEKFKEYNKKRAQLRINCECGGRYRPDNKPYHFKTIKHKTWEDNSKN